MGAVLRQLWRGEVPLPQVFWTYTVLYGLLVNLLTSAAALALFELDMPTALALAVFLLPLPYNLLMVVAVWRSADRFQGPRHWADLARGVVIVWALALTFI